MVYHKYVITSITLIKHHNTTFKQKPQRTRCNLPLIYNTFITWQKLWQWVRLLEPVHNYE